MAQRQTYYEILGVPPGAKLHDIGLAYNRLVAARRRPDAPPDPRGETLLKEAFAVLSDLDRRRAYDNELRKARLKPAFSARQGVVAAAFVALVAAGAWMYARRSAEPPAPIGRTPQEIAAAATSAIGRLSSMDMSGQSKSIGVAFAVNPGVMVTSCHGIAPNAQLSVNLSPRIVPARVAMTDEALGLCKLEVDGAGSWPISISGVEARAGDVVYATSLNARGEVVLREARVKRVTPDERGRVVDVTIPLVTDNAGAPLLDIHGRVVGVTTLVEGKNRVVVIPPAWTDATKPSEPTAPAATPPAGEGQPPGVPAPNITPERRERLEKAFRPPPNVPDDL